MHLGCMIEKHIRNHYEVITRNEFDTLQDTSERHSPNDKLENFVTVINKHIVARKGQNSCKSNKKPSEKLNNYINKQETKGSNNCVG